MNAFIDHCRIQLLQTHPELAEMVDSLIQNNPDYYEVLQAPAHVIRELCPSDTQLREALGGYIRFCDTFQQKQLNFARKNEYVHTDYEAVNQEVYQNETYMAQTYYPALLFSYFFSSNYFEILRVFTQHFIPLIAKFQGQSCEIGIGHGMLSSLCLRNNPLLNGYGLDISPVAEKVTAKVVNILEVPAIHVQVADATKSIPYVNNKVMICAEVLEHLPDPALMLKQIHMALADDGLFFLTASINMESVDHLYLFHNDEEVLKMVEDCGFKVVQRHIAFLTGKNYRDNDELKAKLMKKLNPSTSILILQKK